MTSELRELDELQPRMTEAATSPEIERSPPREPLPVLRVEDDVAGERLVLSRVEGAAWWRRALRRVGNAPAEARDFVAALARTIWSDDPLSAAKIARAIGVTALLAVLATALMLAAWLALIGVVLVLLLGHIAMWLVAWALARAAGRWSRGEPSAEAVRSLRGLAMSRASPRLVLDGADGRRTIPFDAVRGLRTIVASGGGNACELTLVIDTDDDLITSRLSVEALDRDDEALELALRMARILDLGVYRVERRGLATEIDLAPGGATHHPFRHRASEMRPVPPPGKTAPFDAVAVSPGFHDPPAPLPPLDRAALTSDRWQLETWRPGAVVRFTRAPRRDPLRGVLALLLGLVATAGLMGIVWALGVFVHAWIEFGDAPQMKALFAGFTGVSGVGGALSNLPLLWRRVGGCEVDLSWGLQTLRWKGDGEPRHLQLERVQQLVLRGDTQATLEAIVRDHGPVVLWRGEANAAAESLLIDLARAIDAPWRREGAREPRGVDERAEAR